MRRQRARARDLHVRYRRPRPRVRRARRAVRRARRPRPPAVSSRVRRARLGSIRKLLRSMMPRSTTGDAPATGGSIATGSSRTSTTILELAPDVTLRIDHVEAATPNASLIVDRFVGTRDGGPFEMPSVSLASTGATGRISSLTLYDIDDLDTARAEYARLTAALARRPLPQSRLRARADAPRPRRMRATGTRSRAALAPAVEYHDRRTGLAVDLIGDDALAVWRAMFERRRAAARPTKSSRPAVIGSRSILAVAVLRDGEVGTSEASGLGGSGDRRRTHHALRGVRPRRHDCRARRAGRTVRGPRRQPVHGDDAALVRRPRLGHVRVGLDRRLHDRRLPNRRVGVGRS